VTTDERRGALAVLACGACCALPIVVAGPVDAAIDVASTPLGAGLLAFVAGGLVVSRRLWRQRDNEIAVERRSGSEPREILG
jgi:hypothetical protein